MKNNKTCDRYDPDEDTKHIFIDCDLLPNRKKGERSTNCLHCTNRRLSRPFWGHAKNYKIPNHIEEKNIQILPCSRTPKKESTVKKNARTQTDYENTKSTNPYSKIESINRNWKRSFKNCAK